LIQLNYYLPGEHPTPLYFQHTSLRMKRGDRPDIQLEVSTLTEQEEQQGKTYEVKDKRRVNPDGTLKEPQEPEPLAEEPEVEGEEEFEAEEAERPTSEPHEHPHEHADLPMPSVYDILGLAVGLLQEQAWQRMGIRLAPGAKEVEKDMVQAKIAIDTIVFISDQLAPHLGEDERKALRGLVGDLQINFVRQS
jgi:hypothetical protein